MNKTPNKYINIESYNTINNSSSKKGFITVNRLNRKYDNNKTLINQRINNIISDSNNEFKPFIYRKKSKKEKSNSFYLNNKKNLSLRNDKSLIKEPKPLLLIPSYKHFDFKKNYKTYTNNDKNSRSNKKLKNKCKLYLSRNKNSKDKNKRNSLDNRIRLSQNKTKGISNNSTGISIVGDSSKKNINKNHNNNIKKYNCYSYDDEMTIKDDQYSDYYSKETNEDNLSLCLNYKNRNDDKNNNKYIKIIEKENELLKNELIKTNKKLNLLEKKIENIIEGKILRHNTQTILTNSRTRMQTYMKNNIIKKCPVPTPYVQKFSKNDFFSTKHKDIKVTLKLHNRMNNEESKNNC